jgi:ankyrin repeat protein
VKILLEKDNIEINHKDWKGDTVLMLASNLGHAEIVKMLLDKDNIDMMF